VLYREIIAVCSEIHTKHINTLCGQNVEFLNVKHGGAYSDHWAWKVNCETVKLLSTWQNSLKDSLVELEIECNYVNLID